MSIEIMAQITFAEVKVESSGGGRPVLVVSFAGKEVARKEAPKAMVSQNFPKM